jgi:hypothetical protein
MTTRPKNWRQDLIDIEVDSWSDLTVSKPTVEVKLTNKELKYLIETLEINEVFYEESIKEEQERGNEPSDFDVTMLDLLTRLQELRGDF